MRKVERVSASVSSRDPDATQHGSQSLTGTAGLSNKWVPSTTLFAMLTASLADFSWLPDTENLPFSDSKHGANRTPRLVISNTDVYNAIYTPSSLGGSSIKRDATQAQLLGVLHCIK